MNRLKLKDFKVGDKAYIMLTGNAERGIDKSNPEDYIKEVTVTKIGRKYLQTEPLSYEKFKETDLNYNGGLINDTKYCVDYILFKDKQTIVDLLKKENLVFEIRHKISSIKELSLNQLERIAEILDEK